MTLTRNRPIALWESKNPILRNGEYGFEEETGKLKQGDGVTRWTALPYLDVNPYTLPRQEGSFGFSMEELRAAFVAQVDAGTDLATARPTGAAVVYWRFDAGVDVGTGGANVVNRQPGALIYVADA